MQETIQSDLKAAMLAGDKLKVEVLKGLKSALQNQAIDKKAELNDEEVTKVIGKEVKKRNEAAELYGKAGAADREEKELKEAEILQAYLPKQLSDEELDEIIKKVIEENNINSPQKLGMAIGLINKQVGASADGSRVAQAVKKQLGV